MCGIICEAESQRDIDPTHIYLFCHKCNDMSVFKKKGKIKKKKSVEELNKSILHLTLFITLAVTGASTIFLDSKLEMLS